MQPQIDPTPIFELFRGSYGTELLTAAVAHFDVFGRLAERPYALIELQQQLGLATRPALVLTTALRAMNLLATNAAGDLVLTDLAREHLVPGGPFDVGDYVGLAATAPGVLEMVARLRSNRPAGSEEHGTGAAFIYRAGLASAMEQQQLAEHFTLSLAGRAKNVAPYLAERLPISTGTSSTRPTLLDVGGGTGIYSIAYLRREPNLRAIVLDRPEVLKLAHRFAIEYGVEDRLELYPADMFGDPLPQADVVLLSNILHDWDVPACCDLIQRCANACRDGGQVIIHDVLLNDALDGPLAVALYSAALFTLTEGRAYSAQEYCEWLSAAGLVPQAPISTAIHCHAIAATK